jgi:hypothetical protein
VHGLHAGARAGDVAAAHGTDIGARAERIPLAREHHRPHILVANETVERLEHGLTHLQREGVAARRVAQRDERHCAPPLDVDLSHGSASGLQDRTMLSVSFDGINSEF